jgi:hypothetical protein
MSWQLVKITPNGNADMYGGRDGHDVLAISESESDLYEYCEKTYGKKAGKPDMKDFSWDGWYIIEETNIKII